MPNDPNGSHFVADDVTNEPVPGGLAQEPVTTFIDGPEKGVEPVTESVLATAEDKVLRPTRPHTTKATPAAKPARQSAKKAAAVKPTPRKRATKPKEG